MKKMHEICGEDGMIVSKMIQTSEKNIHFVPIFIQNFQILYTNDKWMGTYFFSSKPLVKLLEIVGLLIELLEIVGLLIELLKIVELLVTSGSLKGVDKLQYMH